MCGVPYRPPAATLVARVPGGEQTRADRRAPALEKGVQRPQQGKGPERGGEAKQNIHHAGGDQPNAHEITRVGAIADDAGEELRQAVGDVKQRRQQADIGAGHHAAREDFRRGGVEAFAGEVEQRVAEPDGNQYMATPVAVAGVDFRFVA